MGLEHPDITHIRKTGYPRPIGKPNKTNNTCLDYIKEKERGQMSLKSKIFMTATKVNEIMDKHGVIDFSFNMATKQFEVLFHKVEDFYAECEGYPVEFGTLRDGTMLASFMDRGIKYEIILLSTEETETLKELLNSERVATKS